MAHLNAYAIALARLRCNAVGLPYDTVILPSISAYSPSFSLSLSLSPRYGRDNWVDISCDVWYDGVMASNAITNTGGVTDMRVEMNCSICGYRESTDYDTRTEIQSVCDRGCPRCGNIVTMYGPWKLVELPKKFRTGKWLVISTGRYELNSFWLNGGPIHRRQNISVVSTGGYVNNLSGGGRPSPIFYVGE
jgi:hypothetical protein